MALSPTEEKYWTDMSAQGHSDDDIANAIRVSRGMAPLPPEQPAADEPSALGSFARHFGNQAVGGFGDELYGAGASALNDKSYSQNRDEARTALHEDEKAHPVISFLGDMGGAIASPLNYLIPGGAAAKTLGEAALRTGVQGAVQGGVSALGNSEAKDLGGLAKDTVEGAGAGGLVGGALGAAGHALIGGAEGRVVDRVKGAIVNSEEGSSRATAKAAIAGDDRIENYLVNEPKNRPILEAVTKEKPASAVAGLVDKRVDSLMEPTKGLYSELDKTVLKTPEGERFGTVNVSDVIKKLDAKIEDLATKHGNDTLVEHLETARDRFLKTTQNQINAAAKKGVPAVGGDAAKASTSDLLGSVSYPAADASNAMIPIQELRAATTAAQKVADKSIGTLGEHLSAKVNADVHQIFADTLNAHLDDIKRFAPQAADTVDRILKINHEVSTMLNIKTALLDRAKKEGIGQLKSSLPAKLSKLGGFAALAHGNLPTAAALMMEPYAEKVAVQAVRRGDLWMMDLMRTAKQEGWSSAKLALEITKRARQAATVGAGGLAATKQENDQ